MVINVGLETSIPFVNAQIRSSSIASSDNTTTIKWTPYTNNKLGISFEYPAGWTVEEKTDRFATGPDVLVYNKQSSPLQSFKFVDHKKGFDTPLKILGLEFVANSLQTTVLKDPNARSIEDVSMDKFKVGRQPAASFLIKYSYPVQDVGRQFFLVVNNDKVYTLGYDNTRQNFDTPISQGILNHILNSFKFI